MKFLRSVVLAVAAAITAFCSPLSAAQPEYRALWVDVFHPGLRNAQEIDTMLRVARSANYNAVIVQIRKACDAFYDSNVEPKNEAVAGDFDPLRYLLAQAKNPRNGHPLEVHTWLVAYRCRMPSDSTYKNSRHVYQRHPEWLLQKADGTKEDKGENPGRYYLDPGVPQVIDYNLEVVRDLLSNYDIDGIHFDYLRYPEGPGTGNAWGYNPISVARFNNLYGRTGTPDRNDPQWNDFRRRQVSDLVRKVYAHVRAWRPNVKVSAATITWGNVDKGFERSDAYTGILQDWAGLAQEGFLDIMVPMNYKRESVASQAASHRAWAQFLGNVARQTGRFGVNGVDGESLNSLSDVLSQIQATRNLAGITGIASYCYAETRKESKSVPDVAFFDTIRKQVFTAPAPVPEPTWLTRPTEGIVKGIVTVNGRAADTVEVRVGNRSTLTDGTGFYAVARMAPGTYRVSVSAGGKSGGGEIEVQAGRVSEAPVALR